MSSATGKILSLSTSSEHTFSKTAVPSITLIPGLGIEGDCHAGVTVQHRSRLHITPPPANLRQVHLIPIEILEEISANLSDDERRKILEPGALGQNITTRGIDLLSLSMGTELHFVDASNQTESPSAVIVLTGLRNPCPQINKFQSGLQERFVVRDAERKIVGRLAGVMATVRVGGVVTTESRIRVVAAGVHVALGPV
ncbi:pyruvate kinase-like protein [Aspergillus carlsbadensis]|nr:pyruvate kinase-like protein [Aspergillus carlsbadensis]